MSETTPEPRSDALALVVQLDAVVRTDVTLEALLALLKRQPWLVVLASWWWLTGSLARELAVRSPLDVRWLPYRASVVAEIRRAREKGVPLVLVTSHPQPLASDIAAHLGGFDVIHAAASQGAAHPLQLDGGFELITRNGSSGQWAGGARRILVAGGRRLRRAGSASTGLEVVHLQPSDPPLWRRWMKALRVHQWAKNLLVLVPLFAAHQARDPGKLAAAVIAFLAFSACASSVYLLNDLLDLPSDRRHATKSLRPFAAGTLPLSAGLWATPILLVTAFAAAIAWLPVAFVSVLAAYWVITLSYSLWLKQLAILDVLTLSGLYTVRILAGSLATSVVVSDWLLIFSIFLFLSLALVKRYSELQRLGEDDAGAHGRGYERGDLALLGQLGGAAGYLSVLVLALYIHSPEITRLYGDPGWLWLACPLALYWVSRVWLVTSRGAMNDDPVVFALRDRPSHLVVLIGLLLLWLAA